MRIDSITTSEFMRIKDEVIAPKYPFRSNAEKLHLTRKLIEKIPVKYCFDVVKEAEKKLAERMF